MKGIVHYIGGLAVASCVPGVAAAGAAGEPWLMLLGGVAALLPDTVDFKIRRFLAERRVVIQPDPHDPDPAVIAAGIAAVIQRTWDSGLSSAVKFSTIPLGPRKWLPYEIFFDVAHRRVEVTVGSAGGGGPLLRKAVCKLNCPLRVDYEARVRVDILDGPLIEFENDGDSIVPRFLPWHRGWTHSLVVSLMAGMAVGALFGWRAGLVAGAGHASHVLLDQAGGLGCALWSPFRHKRLPGKQWLRSSDAAANAWLVWVALVILYGNLQAVMPGMDSALPGLRMLGWAILPYFVMLWWNRRQADRPEFQRMSSATAISGQVKGES